MFTEQPGGISAFNSVKNTRNLSAGALQGCWAGNTPGGIKQQIPGAFLGCDTHKSSFECLPNSHFISLNFPPGEVSPAGTHATFVRRLKTQNNLLHRGLKREFLSHGVGKDEKRIKNEVFNENGKKSLSKSTFG